MAAVLTLCSLLLPAVIGTRSEERECAFSDHLQQRRVGPQRSANLLQGERQDNSTVRCSRGLACFGLWEQRPGGEVLLLKQGCWTSQPDCLSDLCLVTAPPAQIHRGSYRFCCCSRHMCNTHFREALPTAPSPVHRLPDGGGLPGNSSALVAVGTVAVAIIAIALLFCGYTLLTGKKKVSSSSLSVMESTVTPCDDMDELSLWELIGRGRFASVYRGSLGDRVVAVKVFSSAQRQKFSNQRAMYRLPLLRQQHDLAHFLCAHEKSDGEGCMQYLIVMDYYPHGCLSHFLSHSCVDWVSCCRMVLGVTRGLSFLHSEVHTGDQFKPAVAHRDVSSSNVLVRSDLTCVLSGFSLSMSLSRDSHGDSGGDHSSAAISEAGTLRYCSPELLSGALDLREYGSALKQVDVYALGLLLWESFRRCHDLFHARAVPLFELAFEAELGPEPSLEDLHRLVSREKTRPLFPLEWTHSGEVLRLLKETVEDCWDQDAEARLSAQCVEERLSQLSQLSAPEVLTASYLSDGRRPPPGHTSPTPDHLTQDHSVSGTGRAQEEHRRQQQVLPQRPSSLQLLPTATSRDRPLGLQSRDRRVGPQSRARQVETGVAKMNAILARPPTTVTTATNRGAVLMADGSSAGAPILVTNSLMVRGLTNRAGPQPENEYRSSDELASIEQGPGPNFLWSPEEDQPLLKSEVPPAGAFLSAQHSNANNNNNYSRSTHQCTGHSEGTCPASGSQLPLSVSTETRHLLHLSEDVSHGNHDPDVAVEILNCIQPHKQTVSCRNGVLTSSTCEGHETAVTLDSPKDSADTWNMDIISSQTCEDLQPSTVMNFSVPLPQRSSEHPIGVCLSPVSHVPSSKHLSPVSPVPSSEHLSPVSPVPSAEHLSPVSPVPSAEHLSPVSPVPSAEHLSPVSPVPSAEHLSPVSPVPSAEHLSPVSHVPSSRHPTGVQSTASPHRDRRPTRPCSLDLSSAPEITGGAPLTDSGLSASGEKIRRRVKTPYTVKKWRPASWVPPADHHPALLLQASPDRPRIGQSQSSMAVFLQGGGTASSSPDGLTTF